MHPYITPSKLLAGKHLPVQCDIAIICLCPMPKYLEQFKTDTQTDERLFVQLHPIHVTFCQHNDINFIVCSEVYGGPVCASTIEELHYYGVKCIIGIGFVGSIDDKFNIGDIVQATNTLSEKGTTPHYYDAEFINGDENIIRIFDGLTTPATIWTTNVIYREYEHDVQEAKNKGCHVVNMDTSHLFAVCILLDMTFGYFATVSDKLVNNDDTNANTTNDNEWKNGLTTLVENENNYEAQNILIEMILGNFASINELF